MTKLVGYVLVRVEPEEGKTRSFAIPTMVEDLQKEEVVPYFVKALEECDIEIFKVEKYSLITSDGIYTIKDATEDGYEINTTTINLKDE